MSKPSNAPAGQGRPRQSLADRAYERLKRALIEWRLVPGQQSTEAELAEHLGIGKTPVREALTRLVHEGWFRSIPGHGYVVSPVTLRQIDELYEVRMLLEPAAVGLAARRMSGSAVEQLRTNFDRHSVVEGEVLASSFIRHNLAFHTEIVAGTGNAMLVEALSPFLEKTERIFQLSVWTPEQIAESVEEHRAVVEAVEAGDGDRAAEAATAHLESARDGAIVTLARMPSVQAAAINVD